MEVNHVVSWQANSEVCIHWKGAAEMVLSSCTKFMDLNGEVHSIEGNEVSGSNFLLREQCSVAISLPG